MLSVIIPTLNEASFLSATLEKLQAETAPHETLVVDGGSQDNTVDIAESAGCRVVLSPETHRARQLNLGARNASGQILFFLHADTLTPPGALERIEAALGNPRIVGGGFTRRFAHDSIFLKMTCRLADLRSRCPGWFLGDQGMFVRREVFERMGGFRELPLFEDLDFSRRLARCGRVTALGPPVVSSARRFAARGPFLTTCADFWLTCRFLCGTDPHALARGQRQRARTEANAVSVGVSH